MYFFQERIALLMLFFTSVKAETKRTKINLAHQKVNKGH